MNSYRIFEKILFLVSYFEVALLLWSNHSLLIYTKIIIIILFAFNRYFEGFILCQVPLTIGLLTHLYTNDSLIILGATLVISTILRIKYGAPNFSSYPSNVNAPYDVGTVMARTMKFGNEVQVFYPIDKKHHREDEADWAPHGIDTIRAIT